MKVKFVFGDWLKNGKSVYNTEEGITLSSGDFHSGTILQGTMELDDNINQSELEDALKRGYQPVFIVYGEDK